MVRAVHDKLGIEGDGDEDEYRRMMRPIDPREALEDIAARLDEANPQPGVEEGMESRGPLVDIHATGTEEAEESMTLYEKVHPAFLGWAGAASPLLRGIEGDFSANLGPPRFFPDPPFSGRVGEGLGGRE
jgi:hypothetical protein